MSERQGGAPLGILLGPSGADVAVYSAHASAAYLCLYDEAGEHETDRVRLTPDDDGVHRGQVAGLRAGTRYGFRVDGPFQPSQGIGSTSPSCWPTLMRLRSTAPTGCTLRCSRMARTADRSPPNA